MKDEMRKYEYWLANLTGISSRKRIQAAALAGTAEELFDLSEKAVRALHIFTEKEEESFFQSRKNWEMERQWEAFQETGIKFYTYSDPDYPTRLAQIYQPPYAVYGKGNLPGTEKTVGIVGARMCSEYGRALALRIGKTLAEHGVSVISGLALGIDSAGHAGALQGNGATYAVLGCGCDICYPRASRTLYRNIANSSGGILSEYAPGTPPMPYRFPERNRLISGLSDVLVVVEAKEKSGSLITVDCALEQGKDVYAVPGRFGDTLSRGCNRLIYHGAGILYDIDIFLEEIGVLPEKNENFVNSAQVSLEKDEILVYSVVDSLNPKYINNIIEETGLPLLQVLHILEHLKKSRLVQETFQNYYCRCL